MISILAGKYTDGIVIKNHFYKTASVSNGGKKATGSKLSAHLKYLEHRPKDEHDQQRAPDQRETREDRYIFNAESDHITRKEAVNDVIEHTHNRVAYHVMVLSPDPNEPVIDLREWTRDIMRDFAEQQGKEVHWYAVQHTNTADHPHVHAVIAGAGEAPGKERLEPVTIFHQELDQLHESAFAHSDHELYQQLEEMHQADLQELHELEHASAFTQHDEFER